MIAVKLILLVSIGLQITSAIVALRLIKTTGYFWGWLALATAICLMAIRRIVSFQNLLSDGASATVNIYAEIVALAISILMLYGIINIRPILRSLYAARNNLEIVNQKLRAEVVKRKKAQEAATINEEKFRKLAEFSPVYIWMSDTTGLCTYFNQRWLNLRGRTMEQEKGMGWTDGLHQEDKKNTINKYLKSFKNRESFELEYRLLNNNNEYRWIYDIGTPMYDDNENFLGYIGSCIDFTERKKMQKALKESEEKFRNIFNNSPIGIFRTTPRGKFLEVNPALAKMLGYNTPEEVINSIQDISKEIYVNSEKRKEIVEEAEIKQGVQRYENVYRKKDGKHFTANLILKTVKDIHGNIEYLEGIVEDITHRKEAEQKLKESEAQKSLILETMGEKLLYMDTDLRVQWTNQAALNLINKKEEEFINKHCYKFWHNSDEPCPDCPAVKTLKSGEKEVSTIPLGDKIYKVHAYPVKEDNTIKGILEVGEDITERKKAEEELSKSEKKFRMFFDESNAVKLLIDPETGAIIRANKKAKSYYGYQNLETKNIRKINQLTNQEVNQEMKKAYHKNKNHFHFRHKLASGEIRHVEVHSTPLEIDNNRYLYSIIHDITERVKAKEALLKSEEKFRKIVNSLPQFVSFTDKNLTYRFVNKTYQERFDLREEDIIGKKLPEVIGEESYKKARPYLDKVFNGEKVQYREHFHYKNGMDLHMEGLLIPTYDDENQVTGYYAILSDITHLVKAREDLERSHKRIKNLSEYQQDLIEKERNYIAREIHDDLGQYLTAIHMGLDWIKKQVGTQNMKVRSKALETIQLTNTVLQKVKKLSTELHPRIIDEMGLQAAIEWYVREFEQKSNIECQLNLPEDEIELDSKTSITLFRILQETLTNVYRHAKANRVNIKLEKDEKILQLTIEDNGRGITEKEKNQPGKMGIIGMEERVHILNGELNIEKIPGNGTRISINLPLKKTM